MKPITKILLVLLILAGLNAYLPASSPEELLFKLPVRVISESKGNSGCEYVKDLKKEDFELRINGEKTPIRDFFARERVIEDHPQGRQLVLSFAAADYSVPLAQTVAHFVNHLMAPGDELLLRSPLHTYQINTQFSKAEVLQFIESSLKTDFQQWKDDKTASLNMLLQSMDILGKKLAAKKAGFRSVSLFIGHYATEWKKFDKAFLLATLENYGEIASRLAQAQGEKWILHFQERDLMPMLTRFQQLSVQIKNYLSSLPDSYKKDAGVLRDSLDKIEKSMLFAEDFSTEELLNAILGVNINYNVVLFCSLTETAEGEDSFSPGYEKVLTELARKSGGISVITENTNLLDGLTEITKHRDFYYEVIFPLGGVPGDKVIDIKVPGSPAGIYYKNRFKEAELAWLMDYVKEEISLSGVSLVGHQLEFTVSGYKMNKTQDAQGKPLRTGYIKIEIKLIDDNTDTVYESGNTLHANDPTFNVSVTIPPQFKGYYKLSIAALDLVSNQRCESNQYVKI